jgi:glutamine synthetase
MESVPVLICTFLTLVTRWRDQPLAQPLPRGARSQSSKNFVAGLLEHMPAIVALTCPSFVSYQRLRPHSWAGPNHPVGYDNRECAVQLSQGREAESINWS